MFKKYGNIYRKNKTDVMVEINHPENHESSESIRFRRLFNFSLDRLADWETSLGDLQRPVADWREEHGFNQIRKQINKDIAILPSEEQILFERVLEIFSIKHGVGAGKIILTQLKEPSKGKFIGLVGNMGVGKTTICKVLQKDLKAEFISREPHTENPFWEKSQADKELMLQSQIFFLASNWLSEIQARIKAGVSIADTSVLTDYLMWAEWYNQTGRFSDEDYQVYKKLFNQIESILPKPDLIVALTPKDIEINKLGLRQRQEDEPARANELIFADKNNNELSMEVDIVKDLVNSLPNNFGVRILHIADVDPVKLHQDLSIQYDIVYQIRSELGILGEYLKPSPKEAALEVMNFLAPPNMGNVVVLDSKSMFSGKTSVLLEVAKTLGSNKIAVFQPKNAIRFGNEQMDKIMTNDKKSLEAKTIESNDLGDIVKMAETKIIDSKKTPYIFIDEVMLFTENYKNAVNDLESLRKFGFHVIVTGVDYTFNGQPFTNMFDLLNKTIVDSENWHHIQLSTRCRYCEKEATVTRRLITDENGNKRLAREDDPIVIAGSINLYEPVCGCGKHISFDGQLDNFQKLLLPTEL